MEKTYEIGGKTLTATCFRKGTSSAYSGVRHYLYKICLSVRGRQVYLKYHDTAANYVSGAYPDIDTALHEAIGYAYDFDGGRSLESFAASLGCGIDAETVRDFKDCRKSFYKLRAVLSMGDIKELYGMTR